MTQAINSGQLNDVGFPGAEEGLSLVELIGTVTVVCAISTVSLIKVANASTVAKAQVSAGVVTKFYGNAETTAAATCTVSERHNTPFAIKSTSGTCTGAASVVIRHGLSASIVPTAGTSVVGYVEAAKSATTSGTAVVSSPAAKTHVFRNATTSGNAATSVVALRGIPFSATATPRMSSTSSVVFVRNISASTTGYAVESGSGYIKKTSGATASPEAITSAAAVFYRITSISSAPSAVVAPVPAGLQMSLGASAIPRAQTSASHRFNLTATAQTVAQAATTSTAADYGIAMPAPSDRTMIVQASNRHMEVLTWY